MLRRAVADTRTPRGSLLRGCCDIFLRWELSADSLSDCFETLIRENDKTSYGASPRRTAPRPAITVDHDSHNLLR